MTLVGKNKDGNETAKTSKAGSLDNASTNPFKDWLIDGYTATSPDNQYRLWIANGFSSFTDHEPHHPRQTLLKGVRLYAKYSLWRKLQKERRDRFRKFVRNPETSTNGNDSGVKGGHDVN